MNQNKQQTKNPLPKVIENLTLAFDVSTTQTGFAMLMEGKPIMLPDGNPSVGFVQMVAQDYYEGHNNEKDENGKLIKVLKHRDKEYATYGNRMFHGSQDAITRLSNKVFQFVKPLNDHIGLQKKNYNAETKKGIKPTVIKNITIVFEVAEIPNYAKINGRNIYRGQNLTSTRKLALYVGLVVGAVQQMFSTVGFHLPAPLVKMIKPTEWQQRLFEKQGDRQKTKAMSMKLANAKLAKWGLQPSPNDDMADAINIASVAHLVRDNVFVSSVNLKKKKKDSQLRKELGDTKLLMADLTNKATEAKNAHLTRIREAKNSKFDYNTEKQRHLITFLTAYDRERYRKYVKFVEDTEATLRGMSKEKAIKNG